MYRHGAKDEVKVSCHRSQEVPTTTATTTITTVTATTAGTVTTTVTSSPTKTTATSPTATSPVPTNQIRRQVSLVTFIFEQKICVLTFMIWCMTVIILTVLGILKSVCYILLWDKYLADFSPAMGSVSSASPPTPSTPTTPGGSKLSPGNIFKNFFKCVD